MLAASVVGAGEFLRCHVCGGPAVVAATDLPPTLQRDRRHTVLWCREHAEERLAVVDRAAACLGEADPMRADALAFAAGVREALAGK